MIQRGSNAPGRAKCARLTPMIRPLGLLAPLLLLLAGCGAPADAPAPANDARAIADMGAAPRPQADIVRVRLDTELGPIVLALDARRAPVTTANFLAYVDQGRFDGITFYRAARTPRRGRPGLHPGRHPPRRHPHAAADRARADQPHRPPPWRRHHLDGAHRCRAARPAISSSPPAPQPSMDAGRGRPADNLGYAAFGRVVEGMDVVRRILAAPTVPNAGRRRDARADDRAAGADRLGAAGGYASVN